MLEQKELKQNPTGAVVINNNSRKQQQQVESAEKTKQKSQQEPAEKKEKAKPINIEEARIEIDKKISEKQMGYMKSRALYSSGRIWKMYADFIYVGSKIGRILDISKVDERVKELAEMLKKYKGQKIVLFSKNPKDAFIQQLAEIIGAEIKSSYRAGDLTNPLTKDFIDVDVVFLFDYYSNYLIKDAAKLGLPVVALVDPSSETPDNICLYLPCNKYFGAARAFIAKQIATYYLEA
ncbi:MAG: hypothetical protein CVU81_03400 [Euryarchaeota archaeon HGW-Euryarchaeota-1]|nr:MAG: hypothetical protein CVU81_03400 [Euryarchaeota archaeon HGW-Euryarchaeota-1]